MWLDIGPLKRNRDYRLLFFGQFVSSLGTMTSYVAVPYQIYEITKSPLLVGILGIIQLVPVLIFSLLGGVLADALNRKTLLWLSEVIMAIGAVGLAINACLPHPQVSVIFALAFSVQAAASVHRPALEALRQSLVEPDEYPAMGALSAFQSSFTSAFFYCCNNIRCAHFTCYYVVS